MIRLYTVNGYIDVTPPPVLLPTKDGGFSMPGRDIKHSLAIFSARVAQEMASGGASYWPWQESDSFIYSRLGDLYRDLAQKLNPPFDPIELLPEYRHRFFISTEPVPHPKKPSTQVRGLSLLEQMLGMEYEKGGAIAPEHAGTGDPEIDALVSCSLLFKSNAPLVLTTLGAKDVASAIRFASYLTDPERSKSSGAPVIDETPEVTDPEFLEARDAIIDVLASESIEFPPGF